MTTSALSRRARFRSQATLESYRDATLHLLRTSPGRPVIPAPTNDQADLEGLAFLALRTLHYPETQERPGLPGVLEISRLQPERERLVVDLAGGAAGALNTIGLYLLPEAPNDADYLDVGVAGLRMRDLDQGVEFYRLGKPGSVVFNGISFEQVMDAHNDCKDGEHRCTVLESPDAMTSTELREDDYRGSGDGLKVVSSVVRRLGLLTRLGSRSIDTWIGNPDHICVEAFINPLDNGGYFALIADLLSPMLSPTWELVALGNDAPYSSPRPQFQIPGLDHHLDLRLRFSVR